MVFFLKIASICTRKIKYLYRSPAILFIHELNYFVNEMRYVVSSLIVIIILDFPTKNNLLKKKKKRLFTALCAFFSPCTINSPFLWHQHTFWRTLFKFILFLVQPRGKRKRITSFFFKGRRRNATICLFIYSVSVSERVILYYRRQKFKVKLR